MSMSHYEETEPEANNYSDWSNVVLLFKIYD